MHLQPYYKKLGYEEGLCSNVEDLYNKMITLPLHANMSDKDLQDVVLAVNKVLNYYKK
ncbi:DegT/DnrJ/EryC1/StrS family aminotransferase [Terrisporobacter petrolearius]|uniref:DegT/DnrJ/EryC1/StrS family aminotransferase n=1 Tax=Terrisporobacter petrolearius TaxID=1460447 RepID=UPI00292D471C|nr:DegT/DnrJ/EryC1/StrS family aminotransferase [Terrisporobacter petrolearius]